MEKTSNAFDLLFLLFVLLIFSVKAQILAENEVIALQKIAQKLGKTNWNFDVDPCIGTGEGNWVVPNPRKGFESAVVCDCSLNTTTTTTTATTAVDNYSECHVISMSLKGENLSGVLPWEFSGLRHLQHLDLSRNVIGGTIPMEWSTMPLTSLCLMGNRLSGPFPEALVQMTTLMNLSIEGNQFTGPIPSEIGNLVHLERLTLSANQFTGNLPSSLVKLTNLTDLRISSNNFTGKIPDFIQTFTKLTKLHIQGSSLEGPIPFGISKLTNLYDLRITDLRGKWSAVPDLSGMTSIRTIMLRNCSLRGELPSCVGDMKRLRYLDFSYNQLTGEIPSAFSNLRRVDYIYLTANMLTGTMPNWILKRNKNVDVSNNNFIMDNVIQPQCPQGVVNMVESYSQAGNRSTDPCLRRNFPCGNRQPTQRELYINCGGESVIVDGKRYEPDTEQRGASMLFLTPNWAYSSTGNFMDDSVDPDNYIATNSSLLSMRNPELYTNARLSPISLKYYGRCMINGEYTVKLHFAEIIFTDDDTFASTGERLFNIYIQGRLVLEDFNIANEAGGPGKAIILYFTTYITDNTLEILLYWAGKGTTGIPMSGNYGPLISAISVTANFEPPNSRRGFQFDRSKQIAVLTINLFILAVIIFCMGMCWRKRKQDDSSIYRELKSLDLQTGSFTLRQIKAATRNFDPANKIGEGGFGSVYKGLLSDGTIIAVKQLSSKSRQGSREFVNEIGLISSLQHPNLVKLYGCCTEGNQLLVIYEFMENNCLAGSLFGRGSQSKLKLDWPTRRNICLGIARGLTYLHEESILRIVHRDIKATNVLLDKNFNAKISDFGLAKLYEDENSHISTKVAGTIGYMAPEYALRGHLTDKADVYSFGVVALETVSGMSNTDYRPQEEFVYLLDWAQVLQEKGTILELVDPELGTEYSREEAKLILTVALLCTNASPTLRPSMSKVVSLLEGRTPIQPLLTYLSLSPKGADRNTSGVRRSFWENPSESHTMSFDESLTGISVAISSQENDAGIVPLQASDYYSITPDPLNVLDHEDFE